ncbi:MAG: hypothetical protein BWY91_02211 [bacterium ADurb.BinA028]|nr:MAG: hypothetical protein BWY91_02211 [bacterium ADurb.BinA028]
MPKRSAVSTFWAYLVSGRIGLAPGSPKRMVVPVRPMPSMVMTFSTRVVPPSSAGTGVRRCMTTFSSPAPLASGR